MCQRTTGTVVNRTHSIGFYVTQRQDPSATATYGGRYLFSELDQDTFQNLIENMSLEDVAEILERLEMQVVPVKEGWEVTAPSCRFDIAIEVDLIEEVGRIYGFAEMPTNRGMSRTVMQSAPEAEFDLHRAKQVLVNRGG